MVHSGSELADWLVRIESFSAHEIELGLERVTEVLGRLQLPPPDIVLTVAGTNGKGSSVAMAAAALAGHGQRIGTYTSPHVLAFNERIAVDLVPAADDEIVAAFERIETVRGDVPLTYFEYTTIAALAVFDARDVDVAILEVGMGGRLDAVNAIEPTAGLITNIALDHREWLGDDVEAIAAEKAGIMRSGRPVVFASRNVPQAIRDVAKESGAELRLAGRDYDWQEDGDRWSWRGRHIRLDELERPGLPGAIQITNAAGVLALLEAAGLDAALECGRINQAFGRASLAGRLQAIDTDRRWLLDVAHNPAAAEVLGDAISAMDHRGRTIAIVGLLDDKDVEGVVAPLAAAVDGWIAAPARSPRAVPVEELARRIANATGHACLEAGSVAAAIAAARDMTHRGDRVVVTGSFFIVGPALALL